MTERLHHNEQIHRCRNKWKFRSSSSTRCNVL